MYSSKNYLQATREVMKKIKYDLICGFDCPMTQIPNITGVSYGCIKHTFYDEDYASNSAPRYDRVIRLLAGKHLPYSVLAVNGVFQAAFMDELVAMCVRPIQQAAAHKVKLGAVGSLEAAYFPSWKRVKSVAKGQIPQLDFVVRFLMGGTISVDNLVPPLQGVDGCTLPNELTDENTRDFFAALKRIFSVK